MQETYATVFVTQRQPAITITHIHSHLSGYGSETADDKNKQNRNLVLSSSPLETLLYSCIYIQITQPKFTFSWHS